MHSEHIAPVTMLCICSFGLAPMHGTITDFWRLVWQEKVQNIAMLTNLMDGRQRKCEQYWPKSGSEEYGPFMVNLIEEQVFADYTIRTMHLVVRTNSQIKE